MVFSSNNCGRKPIPSIGFYPQQPISTGTTLIAMEFDGGVVVGTDSRTSSGSFIPSRATDKITPVTDRLVVCRSGSAADTQAIADIVKYYIEVYSMMENEEVNIWRSAHIFRNFLYKYRDQLSASVLVAGYDEEQGGQLYAIPLGGFVSRQRCAASGSGSTFVQGFLDSKWKPNMSVEECKEVVKNAVALATYRDGSSGGVIRLAVIDKTGITRTLIRPDGTEFPKFEEIPGHLTFPKHIIQ
uniref:Proteasome subunit beta n=1 Tax=Syphacia muris TaxID=451379 RepID=A0A0N5AGL6_9BILA